MTEYSDPTVAVAEPATSTSATADVAAPTAPAASTLPATMAPPPVPGAPTPAPAPAPALASSEPPAEPARRLSDVTLPPPPTVAAAPEPVERVGRGLAVALLVVLGAGVLAVVVWNLGYVASVTSVVLAAGAVLGYAKVAGAPPRRGMLPLLALIVLGVVGTALALVGWDASRRGRSSRPAATSPSRSSWPRAPEASRRSSGRAT